jgi:hypothetical protein
MKDIFYWFLKVKPRNTKSTIGLWVAFAANFPFKIGSVGAEKKFRYSYCTVETTATATKHVINDGYLRLAITRQNASRVLMFSKAEFSKPFSSEIGWIASAKDWKRHGT